MDKHPRGQMSLRNSQENSPLPFALCPLIKLTKFFADLKTGESISLVMYEYTDWPDHSVPGKVESLIRVIQIVQKSFAASKMVVHSSTGVGRTGTFFALHKLMQLVDANVRHLDIFQIVLGLRRQRKFMVTFLLISKT